MRSRSAFALRKAGLQRCRVCRAEAELRNSALPGNAILYDSFGILDPTKPEQRFHFEREMRWATPRARLRQSAHGEVIERSAIIARCQHTTGLGPKRHRRRRQGRG